jgi:hypothetical protein
VYPFRFGFCGDFEVFGIEQNGASTKDAATGYIIAFI